MSKPATSTTTRVTDLRTGETHSVTPALILRDRKGRMKTIKLR
jgi:hypothetical protein